MKTSIGSLEMANRKELEAEYARLRGLMGKRQSKLEKEMAASARAACNWHYATTTLELVDGAGQISQYAISFVPGAGTATTVGLDSARAFVDAYNKSIEKGLSHREAMQRGMLGGMMGGASSFALSKLGPQQFKNLKNAKRYSKCTTMLNGAKSIKAGKKTIEHGAKYMGKATANLIGGHVAGKAVNTAAMNAPVNNAPTPSVSMAPSLYSSPRQIGKDYFK